MTVVYVDSVFLLNGLMDYLLLLGTARLAGIPLKRRRYFLGALLGGAYAVAVFLPGLSFLSSTPVKLAYGLLLSLTAFGGEEKLARLTLLLAAVSCAMAGCVLGLGLLAGGGVPMANGVFYTDVDGKTLLLAATAAYLVLTVIFRTAARHGIGGQLASATVRLNGRSVCMSVLLDSGNGLCDPLSGEAVLVAAPGALDGALPPPVRRLLTAELLRFPADLLEQLRAAAPQLKFYLLPYRAVGVPGGLLLAVRSEWTDIGGQRHSGLPVALSPTALGAGYQALWGGPIRRRGRNGGGSIELGAPAAETSGTAGAAGRSLHRRQRHAAAAADEGTGGAAAGPAGGGAGQAGAHRT